MFIPIIRLPTILITMAPRLWLLQFVVFSER